MRPRSGLALKHGVTVLNAPGTIDSDYRGPVGVLLANFGAEAFTIARGDRIAQLIVAPVCPRDLRRDGDAGGQRPRCGWVRFHRLAVT